MNLIMCNDHRKELLRFLLLKTAAVRSGVKPGELLRVQHCYQSRNAEGFQFCLYRRDIFEILKLDYLELRVEAKSSLVLFYQKTTMSQILEKAENREILIRCGYPEDASSGELLELLRGRFQGENLPHEVGVFIGYPAKDVAGFLERLPRTPVHRGDWAVFGDAGESLSRMTLYRQTEEFARNVLDVCGDLQTFFDRISHWNRTDRSVSNG